MITKKKTIILVIIVCLIELLFNIDNFAYSFGKYKEDKIDIDSLTLNNLKNDKTYFLSEDDNPSIEIKNINKKVANIYLDFELNNSDKTKINYTDDMFSKYKRYNKNTYSKYNKRLTNCHFYGNLKSLKITFDMEKNQYLKINSIILNKENNFSINIIRMICLFVIGYFLMFIYYNKFTNLFDKNNKKQKRIIYMLLFIIILSLLKIFAGSLSYTNEKTEIDDTYSKEYTDSILDGHFYLNKKPDNSINNNPRVYDYSYRGNIGSWDTVYFNGKYYIYFGILPQLLLFIPFKLLTGKYLSVGIIVLIFQILSIIVMSKFYREIINKYFKKVPFIIYVLGLLFFIISSRLVDGIESFHVYQMIPIIAFYLIIQGLYFILRYDSTNKNKYLLLATSFLSLAVACRPNSLFISILILPILIKKLQNKEFTKVNMLSVIFPYLIVGTLLMYFNYIRFGNIFEFGFKYQLTIADYRKLPKCYYNIGLGIFYYLLAPLNVVNYYPYVEVIPINNFAGYVFSENIRYSIMATIIPIIYFTIPLIKNSIKKYKELWLSIKIMLILGLVMIIFDSLIAGIVFRYMIDFVFLFNITSILISFYIYTAIKEKNKQLLFLKGLSICIIISIILQILLIISY